VTRTMRAARWHGRRDVRVEDVPVPVPGPGDVVIRVAWCGVCGTDLEEYRDGPLVIPVAEPNRLTGGRAPLTLGHEFSGTVAALGDGVEGFAIGDRVVPEVCLSCGECWYCRRREYALCLNWAAIGFHADGGLAEFVKVPARLCLPLPDAIGDEEAALIETTEVAVRAVRKGGVGPGDSVVVVGDGAVGLIAVQVARAAGAGTVILAGHHEARCALGLALGATAAVDSRQAGWLQAVAAHTEGRGADVVIETGGSQGSVADAVAASRKGATIVMLAVIGQPIPFATWPIVEGERRLIGSVQHHFDEDLPAAIGLLASGSVNVRPLISRRIPLERVVEDVLDAPRSASDVKVLVSPARTADRPDADARDGAA
jgi:(R,R)-butanediol dehydrogenase/meso-butanediol dehydrogenase/diacetyl reductase